MQRKHTFHNGLFGLSVCNCIFQKKAQKMAWFSNMQFVKSICRNNNISKGSTDEANTQTKKNVFFPYRIESVDQSHTTHETFGTKKAKHIISDFLGLAFTITNLNKKHKKGLLAKICNVESLQKETLRY
jgi:hypothetical protein